MIEVGPPTVANRAPTASASALASSLSPSGAMIASSSSADAAGTGSPPEVLRQSDSSTVRRRGELDRSSCAAAARSARDTSVTPKPRRRSRSPTSASGSPPGPLGAHHDRVVGERHDRAGVRRPQCDRRCSQGRGRQPSAVHRAGPVDQQTHRGLRPFPCGGDQCRTGRAPVGRAGPRPVRRARRPGRGRPANDPAVGAPTAPPSGDPPAPDRARSTMMRPARRRASVRRRSSVAAFMSARSASASSGSTESSSSNADSSSCPNSGEISAKFRRRESSLRDVVRREASATAASASSPSSTWSGPAGRPPPGGGFRLFPSCPAGCRSGRRPTRPRWPCRPGCPLRPPGRPRQGSVVPRAR